MVDAITLGREPTEILDEILQFVHFIADDETICFDYKVATSEIDHEDRNAALAHFMKSFGHLQHNVDNILNTYFHQCSIAMSC